MKLNFAHTCTGWLNVFHVVEKQALYGVMIIVLHGYVKRLKLTPAQNGCFMGRGTKRIGWKKFLPTRFDLTGYHNPADQVETVLRPDRRLFGRGSYAAGQCQAAKRLIDRLQAVCRSERKAVSAFLGCSNALEIDFRSRSHRIRLHRRLHFCQIVSQLSLQVGPCTRSSFEAPEPCLHPASICHASSASDAVFPRPDCTIQFTQHGKECRARLG